MRKINRTTFAVLAALALLLCLLSACGKPSYTVTFDLNGGELVSGETEQTVEEGAAATAPEARNGRLALSWDKDFSSITADTTVTAQWSKVAMDSVDLAGYVQERTVTVNVTTVNDYEATGSGFFIDDQGTLVTNFHVIEGAATISVQVSGGGSYDVKTIVDFNPVYDLAILQLDMTGNPYLDICADSVKTGEQVYAVGSALGTLTGSFTAGTVSSISRSVGQIDCIQMDAAISHGNSGGPLVNVYGEVVGINSFSFTEGENLNLAIKISMLDKLARDKNMTINDLKEWYTTETSRSYSPYSETNDSYYYSLVNTYQLVTGAKCLYSVNADKTYVEGYHDCYWYYIYDYTVSEYDAYVAYLKSCGFTYQDDELFDLGTSYYYYNEKDGIEVDLFVTNDNENLEIWVSE